MSSGIQQLQKTASFKQGSFFIALKKNRPLLHRSYHQHKTPILYKQCRENIYLKFAKDFYNHIIRKTQAEKMSQLCDISNVAIRENLSKFLDGRNLSDKELEALNKEYAKNAFLKTRIDLHIQKILKKGNQVAAKNHEGKNGDTLTSLSVQIHKNQNQNICNVLRFAKLIGK